MCESCGCGQPGENVTFRKPGENEEHTHSHGGVTHSHSHGDHDHDHSGSREIIIEQNVLQKNDLLAERNRGYFEARKIFTVNLVSSPGSGKTSLLEKTIRILKDKCSFYIIEGDQQTMLDANRIEKAGAPVIQINTGAGCHLDADMINKAVKSLEIKDNSILLIENVGNPGCPAMFDLGESQRVVIVSVTEGEDKPIKYPDMFQSSDICVINKTDLLPYVDFNVEKFREYACQVNPDLKFFELSAKTEEGMEQWIRWLQERD
ncbi:Hydrogenase maturation factor HypB [subsurface metagenome]